MKNKTNETLFCTSECKKKNSPTGFTSAQVPCWYEYRQLKNYLRKWRCFDYSSKRRPKTRKKNARLTNCQKWFR